MRLAFLCFLAYAALPSLSQEPLPVFAVTPEESKITFYVKASVALEGTFDKWDACAPQEVHMHITKCNFRE